jgi:hypothetical protein
MNQAGAKSYLYRFMLLLCFDAWGQDYTFCVGSGLRFGLILHGLATGNANRGLKIPVSYLQSASVSVVEEPESYQDTKIQDAYCSVSS